MVLKKLEVAGMIITIKYLVVETLGFMELKKVVDCTILTGIEITVNSGAMKPQDAWSVNREFLGTGWQGFDKYFGAYPDLYSQGQRSL